LTFRGGDLFDLSSKTTKMVRIEIRNLKYLKKLTNQQARQLALTLKEGTRRHGGETPPTHKKSATPSSPSITPSRMRTKPISWLAGELQPYKQMSKTPYFRRWRTFTDCSVGGLEPEYYFFQVTDTDMPEGKHFRNNNKGEK
jgi:hypothetical protein